MPGDGGETEVISHTSDAVQSDPGVGPVRKFTWEELSKLNRRHNAHVAVRGKVRLDTCVCDGVLLPCTKVYDVSGFIEKHPGGVDQLMLGAGRDVTILFESYHNFNISKLARVLYIETVQKS